MSTQPTDTLPDTVRPADVLRHRDRWLLSHPRMIVQEQMNDSEAVQWLTRGFGHNAASAARMLTAIEYNGQPADPPGRGGPRPLSYSGTATTNGRQWVYHPSSPPRAPWTLEYCADGQWWAQLPMIPLPLPCGSVLDAAARYSAYLYADAHDRQQHERDVAAPEAIAPGDVLVLSGALRLVVAAGNTYTANDGRKVRSLTFLEYGQAASFEAFTILETATYEEWRDRWGDAPVPVAADSRNLPPTIREAF